MTWRSSDLDLASGLYVPQLVTWDPATGEGTECPEVVIDGDTVHIGEDANTAVLKKDEWNVLVDLIHSGQLSRV